MTHLAARKRKNVRYRRKGRVALYLIFSILVVFLASIVWMSHTAFYETYLKLTPDNVENYRAYISVRDQDKLPLSGPTLLLASSKLDQIHKGLIKPPADSVLGKIYGDLQQQNILHIRFDVDFFTSKDSREPEIAGIWSALKGSLMMMLLVIALTFPIGVLAALYLEEFQKKNALATFIDMMIINLTAVPSIIYGLLGVTLFLTIIGLPRSSVIVGGLVLSLMALPSLIVIARTAIKNVPYSLREAAYGLGANKLQTSFHHVFPAALPGILTGAILSFTRVMGETAPLLLIGMVAFIADAPRHFMDPSSVLPVQIYLWANSPEPGFLEKTAAAILVLLLLLTCFNLIAILLRNKFEKKL
jgi:phosphate ABC transporter permease subunit PstA